MIPYFELDEFVYSLCLLCMIEERGHLPLKVQETQICVFGSQLNTCMCLQSCCIPGYMNPCLRIRVIKLSKASLMDE